MLGSCCLLFGSAAVLPKEIKDLKLAKHKEQRLMAGMYFKDFVAPAPFRCGGTINRIVVQIEKQSLLCSRAPIKLVQKGVQVHTNKCSKQNFIVCEGKSCQS